MIHDTKCPGPPDYVTLYGHRLRQGDRLIVDPAGFSGSGASGCYTFSGALLREGVELAQFHECGKPRSVTTPIFHRSGQQYAYNERGNYAESVNAGPVISTEWVYSGQWLLLATGQWHKLA